jgi:predicted AAA+ superfamily ATPase
MSNLVRYLQKYVTSDLQKKMVLIGGPRQVGKTTFAISLLKPPTIESPAYLNWDDLKNKEQIRKGILPEDEKLIVLDEIHKYKNWRSLIKGFFDKKRLKHQFLVTGSARIDHYSKGGDSLMGRYHFYRMHPLSAPELGLTTQEEFAKLLRLGGFPEPYFENDPVQANRWRRERLRRILQEDLRDLENVKEVSLLEDLLALLPKRVGSVLSYQSLANEIEVDIKTIQKWITIFDNLYLTFRISPYVPKKLRVVKRSHRLYLWDWGGLEDPGAQFENLVASQLLKYCHFLEDTQGDEMELKYLRDVDGREIDFVVLKNKKPLFAVECKAGERAASSHLFYFQQRTSIPQFYQVHQGDLHHSPEPGIEVIPFLKFCKKLNMP